MNIKDLKVGDELIWGRDDHSHFKNGEVYVVTEIDNATIKFSGIGAYKGWYSDSVLQFMEKKEQSQYTFEDLFDVIKKADRDGVIRADRIDFTSELGRSFIDDIQNKGGDDFKAHIRFIQSLYKETFVIESEEDMKKIKQFAKITFQNGNSVTMDQPPTEDGIVRIWNDGRYDFVVLQGATVEQSK